MSAPAESGARRYRAFISYSHQDKASAAWLHRALEGFRIPGKLVGKATPIGLVPERLTPIFRDRDELPASGNLGAELTAALQNALFLVVLCSPAAARSRWVNEEIRTFKVTHGADRVLALVIAGQPNAPDALAELECFPPALRFQVDADGTVTDRLAEPIAADLRAEGDGRRLAKLKLIAGLTGLRLDELVQREAQRRARRLTMIATGSLIGMACAIALALYANSQRIAANEQRVLAEKEATTARAVSNFLVNAFRLANPATDNPRTITALTILDRGARQVRQDLAGQPAVQARLSATMGRAFNNLGLFERTQATISENMGAIGQAGPDGAEALTALAVAQFQEGDFDTAVETARRAAAQLADTPGYNAVRAEAALVEARVRYAEGATKDGLAAFDRALALFRQAPEAEPTRIVVALQGKGMLLSDDGQYDAAEAALNEALEINRRVSGERHLLTGQVWAALAQVAYLKGDYADAQSDIVKAIAIQEAVLDASNPILADARSLQGQIFQAQGQLPEAAAALQQAIDIYKAAFKGPHYLIGIAEVYRGLVEAQRKDFPAALAHFDEAKRQYDAGYGEIHPNHGDLMVNRASVLAQAGRKPEAIQECANGMAILERTLGRDASYTNQMRAVCEKL